MREIIRFLIAAAFGALIVACGGNGKSQQVQRIDPPAAPVVTVDAGIKQLIFGWNEVPGATHYKLMENPDGHSGFTQTGADISAGTHAVTQHIAVHLHGWVNALYSVQACNSAGCTGSAEVTVTDLVLDSIGYFKASNTGAGDRLAWSVAISGDTLAVGAPLEDSAATGIDGEQDDNSVRQAGAVYVFKRDAAGMWSQQAYIKASNTAFVDEYGELFGLSVALSGDTLAVGAPHESSSATGINGDEDNDDAIRAGAVYVFVSDSVGVWSQQAYIKASDTAAEDQFGYSVALSDDTLAVNALRLASSRKGSVDVFTRDGSGAWSQQAHIASATDVLGKSGASLALSGDTLAIGAMDQNWDASVYVFSRNGDGIWSQQANLKASNADDGDAFGWSVALLDDTLAVGAPGEASAATGVDGDPSDNSAEDSGAVYVFMRDATEVWSQQGYIKASNTGGVEPPVGLPPGVGHVGDEFGSAIALAGDTLAVSAPYEDSIATGINGDQFDDILAGGVGAVYTFTRDDTGAWFQQAYVKASNAEQGDHFGQSVTLSDDTLAVGAYFEDSAATGIDGDQSDNSERTSGAVYVY